MCVQLAADAIAEQLVAAEEAEKEAAGNEQGKRATKKQKQVHPSIHLLACLPGNIHTSSLF